MTLLNMADLDRAGRDLPASPFEPVSGFDSFALNSLAGALNTPIVGRYLNESPMYEQRDNALRSRFGDDFFKEIDAEVDSERPKDPTQLIPLYGDPKEQARQRFDLREQKISARIQQGRTAEPDRWGGLYTREEIEQENKRKTNFTDNFTAEQTAKVTNPITRYGTMFGGRLAGAMLDPVNIATLPIGAAASTRTLAAIGIDALANAGIEAIQTPENVAYQEFLGRKVSAGDIFANIALAGAGGGAFTGVARGIGRLATLGRDKLESVAVNPNLPRSVRDSALYLSRVAQVDEALPRQLEAHIAQQNPALSPREVKLAALSEHRKAIQETQDALSNGREPVYSEAVQAIRDRTITAQTVDGVPPKQLERFLPEAQRLHAVMQEAKAKPTSATPKNEQGLAFFVRSRGGIAETAGELAARGITRKSLPGLVRKEKNVKNADMLGYDAKAASRQQLDYMKEQAVDAGYFGGGRDVNDVSDDEFLDAIAQDLAGTRKVYTAETAMSSLESDDAALEQLDRMGITPDMDVNQIARELYLNHIDRDGEAAFQRMQRIESVVSRIRESRMAQGAPEEMVQVELAIVRRNYEALITRYGVLSDEVEQYLNDRFANLYVNQFVDEGAFSPDDARILNQSVYQGNRASITFHNGESIIDLFENADASSFIHEWGHFVTDLFHGMAKLETAPDTLKADYAKMREFVGAKDDAPFTVEQEETMARAFEAYMREGVAPTKDMGGVFARLRDWLLDIYREARDLGVALNDDIRGVFDRWFTPDYGDTALPRTKAELDEIDALANSAPDLIDADFARMLKERGDEVLDFDGEEITLAEFSRRFAEEDSILQAINTCAV